MIKLIQSLCLLTLFSCAHSVHQVHVSDFGSMSPIEKGKVVKSESEQFVILGFIMQSDYVDEARKKLIDQCPNKNIEAISTRYSTSLGFLSWHNKVLMQGLCI